MSDRQRRTIRNKIKLTSYSIHPDDRTQIISSIHHKVAPRVRYSKAHHNPRLHNLINLQPLILPPPSRPLPAPNLISIRLPPGLRHKPHHKRHRRHRRSKKPIVNPALAQPLIHQREKLRHHKRARPTGRQCPRLRRPDCFGSDQLAGEDKGDRAETETEGADEGQDRDGGEDVDAAGYADGEEEGRHTHACCGSDQAGLPAETVDQGREGDGDDEVYDCDDDVEEGG